MAAIVIFCVFIPKVKKILKKIIFKGCGRDYNKKSQQNR